MPRPRTSLAKKIAYIGVPLIILEAGYLMIFSTTEVSSPKEAIEKEVSKIQGIDDRRRAMLQIQTAIATYSSKNGGKVPVSLNELVPNYFDALPIDPSTRKTFSYKVENNRAYVGYDVSMPANNRGKTPKGSSKEAPSLDTSNDLAPELVSYVYDPTGKRDPFRPFDFAPKNVNGVGHTPLERYDYGQLKLTAVLLGMGEPQAIVENQVGRGFSIKKGTRIGLNGGEVVEIVKDKISILETTVDFTGEKKNRTIEMKLRTKDQNKEDN